MEYSVFEEDKSVSGLATWNGLAERSNLRGRAVVLEFWPLPCSPAKVSTPAQVKGMSLLVGHGVDAGKGRSEGTWVVRFVSSDACSCSSFLFTSVSCFRLNTSHFILCPVIGG